jgi:hypothetical protein
MIKLVNQFDQCPNCGSTTKFCASLAKEMVDRKLAKDDFTMYLGVYRAPVIDQRTEPKIPIGSEVPVLIAFTDICQDCGTIYAVRLERDTVKKTLPIPTMPIRPSLLHN